MTNILIIVTLISYYLLISVHPRVTNDDIAFIPKPKPSHIPAANAITFLIAPPNSTPYNKCK